jgi:hypothetical protein
VAILARAELEHKDTTPLAELPPESEPHSETIYLVWPIVCFLVIVSIVVHGSSIAVFTLGKHINTLSLTMSYTQANDANHWTDRLPRIQSRSRTSMSFARSDTSFDEKSNVPMGQMPYGAPGTFLRRQKEDENPSRVQSRASSRHRSRRSRNWDSHGPGGPISRSAFGPTHRSSSLDPPRSRAGSDTPATKSEKPANDKGTGERNQDQNDATSPGEVFEEGHHTVFEDEDGKVLAVEDQHMPDGPDREEFERQEARRLMRATHPNAGTANETSSDDSKPGSSHDRSPKDEKSPEPEKEKTERPANGWKASLNKIPTLGQWMSRDEARKTAGKPTQKPARGPARAYQYGKTIIVEDEDGEVIKKYDIPTPGRNGGQADPAKAQHRIGQMSKMLGLGAKPDDAQPGGASNPDAAAKPSDQAREGKPQPGEDDDDARLRFTITTGGRRMSKAEFIDKIRMMDPKSRVEAVEDSNAPERVKREARKDYREQVSASHSRDAKDRSSASGKVPLVREGDAEEKPAEKERVALDSPAESDDDRDLHLVDASPNGVAVPLHDVSAELREYQLRSAADDDDEASHPTTTAAERRRRRQQQNSRRDHNRNSDDDDELDPKSPSPPSSSRQNPPAATTTPTDALHDGETAAERRRREGALGIGAAQDSDSEDDNEPRLPPNVHLQQQQQQQPQQPRTNIRFADQTASASAGRQSALRWGKNVGR